MERGTMPAGWWSAGATEWLFKTTLILQIVVTGDDKGLIWFFLMGMIAGAVGWNTFVVWYGRRLKKKQQMEAFKKGGQDS